MIRKKTYSGEHLHVYILYITTYLAQKLFRRSLDINCNYIIIEFAIICSLDCSVIYYYIRIVYLFFKHT